MTFAGRMESQFVIPTGGAAMSVTNSGGGPTTVTIPAGTYYLTAAGTISGLLATMQTQLQATRAPLTGSWTVALSTGATGDLRVSITCTGTYSIAWTNTTLRDLLGFAADLSSVTGTQTGTKQARSVWGPDCPLWLQSDTKRAPIVTDLRTTTGPTGVVLGLVGNSFYRHRSLRWRAVPLNRAWEAQATYANASFEKFWKDCQLGIGGLSWFSPASKFQVYDHNGNLLGADVNGVGTDGWNCTNIKALDEVLTRLDPNGNNANWTVELPEMVSSG